MDRHHERAEGERRKQDILQTLAARRECYVNRGRRVLLETLLAVGSASADDVRRAVALPDQIDPRCLGSVPGPLARAGIIRCTGYERSDRKERHASIIAVWELLNSNAAREWLARHPDHPDDDTGPDVAGSPIIPLIPSPNGTGSAVAQPSLF
jgi:hypothetical protein